MADVIARAMANAYSYPLASYIHTDNLEVVVSAVDVDTDTFTSVAHGLANDDRIGALNNIDAGQIYTLDKVPTGVTPGTLYYVVNKTDDTFQISTSSGGSAVNLTTNANMDLTKWHFEKSVTKSYTLPVIPNLSRVRTRIKGRTITHSASLVIFPNHPESIPITAEEWLGTGRTAYGYSSGASGKGGDVYYYADSILDCRNNMLSIIHEVTSIQSATASTVLVTDSKTHWYSPNYSFGEITNVGLYQIRIANGTLFEVYRA